MKFKAIIFDMDGTIIDTSHIWAQATKELVMRKGILVTPELEHELLMRVHGLGMNQACKIIKELTSIGDPIEQIIIEKTKIACNLYKKGIRFIEGFEYFHAQAITYKLKTGIATNADNDTLQIAKEVLGIERFFGPHIYSIACVNNICKPNPAVYLYAAKQLGLKPEECLAIEDSAHGIKAAQGAGMYCIGINTSGNYEQVKQSDLIVKGYKDINLLKLLQLD